MKFSESTNYKYPTVVRHQGVAIALALAKETIQDSTTMQDSEVCNIYYRVLALDPAQPDDEKCWRDVRKLAFPDSLRPAGMSLVTVDLKAAEKTADAPFQALSDGKHVYLFRQSIESTLYVDRFVFDPAQKTLTPNWEARFQRSRKRDLPASRKDTLGARTMEGESFFEPTTELPMVRNLEGGQFSVLLLPGRLPSEWRWQVFAANAGGEIDAYSIRRSEDGLFDIADIKRTCFKWTDGWGRFQTGPAALLYMQQEEAQDEYGRTQRVKRGARVMLAAPVGSSRYALELDGVNDYVEILPDASLDVGDAFTIEAWVKPAAGYGIPQDGHIDIVSRWGSEGASNAAYLLGVTSSGHPLLWTHNGSESSRLESKDALAIDSWSHVAGVLKDGTLSVYINGSLNNSLPGAVAPQPSHYPLRMGAQPAGDAYFKGQINNVRLWNAARSQADIQQGMHGRLTGDEPGLVSYWPFDEGAGDTIYDRAFENHGQLHVGYLLELDGIDDYVSIPHHDSIDFDKDDDFTVAVWIRTAAQQKDITVIDNMIVEKWSGADGYPYVIRYLNRTYGENAGRIVVGRYDGDENPGIISNIVVNDGKFHHVVFVKDGAALYLYIDGSLEGATTDTTTGSTKNDSPLYVGVRGGAQYPFSGHINNLRIWDRGLSIEEIRDDMERPAREVVGAVGNWAFDEGSGDTIHDRASGHHGQLHVGYFLEFDGVDDYVELPDMNPNYVNGFTVEAWVRYSSFQSWSRIIDFGNGAPGDNILFANLGLANDLVFQVYRDWIGSTITAPGALEPNTWMHLAATVDGAGNAALYRDGQLLAPGPMNVPKTWPRTKNYVGRSNWAADGYFDGGMRELRVWNVARSQAEIQTTMNEPLSGDEPGLVGYWPLDEGSGDTIHDHTSADHHGRLCVGCAPDSHALFLDGADDYIELPDMNPDYANGFTVEAWVRYHSFQNWSRIIDFGNGPSQDNILLANGAQTNNLEFHVFQGGAQTRISAPGALEANTWMHLAATVDGEGQAALYKNGQRLVAGPINAPTTLIRTKNYIGRSNWATDSYFDGGMGQVRVWNIARSEAEIQATMYQPLSGDEVGLVGCWPLDETDLQVGRVPDHSDHGNDGVLHGGTLSCIDSGESTSWRWVHKVDIQVVTEAALGADDTVMALSMKPNITTGDTLLIEDEQVRVLSVPIQDSGRYSFEIERGVNGTAACDHPIGTRLYRLLKPADNALLPTTTRVNMGRSASEEGYFRGTLDEVRIWKAGRRDGQIQHFRAHPLPGDAEGLVGHWDFEEVVGSKTAVDRKGSNHGRLIHMEADKIPEMWTPSPRNATLVLYIHGRAVQTSDKDSEPDDYGGYGREDQFTLGAMIGEDETLQQHLAGCIDEVRVWSAVRSAEQIRDNMYRSLSGAEEGLAGYWPLDEGTGTDVHDQTGNGQDGTLQGQGLRWVDSTAPIGNEGPEVRNVYGGLPKPDFNKQIAAPPAAVEYGDMQWDDEGNLFGVMKRCYLFREDAIQLVTGFKVGDLELNFIGQVQTAPTLIGYIEGAPPVPSENLTVNDPVTDDYVGTSAIQLTEAKDTTQVYSASRDTGFDMSVDVKAGLYFTETVQAGLGIQKKLLEYNSRIGLHAYFDHSLSWLSDARVTAGVSKTLTKSLILGGGWEELQDYDQNGQPRYLNPEVGRRYLPNNMGYALVKSGTADLFALRLKSTGSLVAFQVLPNPDIPEDWNIIMFPLDPKYVKNGTLDGMVGLVADADYPGAIAGERGSYFKPLEAYALKEQIERQASEIEGYYESYGAGAKGRTGSTGAGEGELLDELPEEELGYDWEAGRDKRSMANTYVWTADGGFYAEEEQFSSIRQESLGGSYHFLGKAGIFTELKFAVSAGFFLDLDALFGGHVNVTVSKSKEEKATFGLHVDVQGERYLNRWDGDPDKQQGHYTAEPCPGKVDGYRFMTFYLQPKPQNFDRFFGEIVDSEWLNGQGKYAGEYNSNARALREARSKPNEVWRVLHRVTYVSRIPPQFEPTPVEAVPEDVRRPANVEANMGLIREIERIKRWMLPGPDESDLMILGRAADRLLFGDTSGDGQGRSELEKVIPWWADRDEPVKREIRQDVMTYLKAFYESDLTPPQIGEDEQRVTEGLQALYTFEEGQDKKMVQDVSGVEPLLNLRVKKKSAVEWLRPSGLDIREETLVTSLEPATKLIEAAKASNEITIEAWVKPADADQGGPARIVTLSADPHERNFTLGQDGEGYQTRLRTTQTNDNGTDKALEAGDVATDDLSHLVYVREASGEARFYLNGVQVGQRTVGGDFSNWDDGYRFGLGNEFTNDRPWLGELHLVAIYSRALGPAEVEQNYRVGARITQ